MQNLVIPEIMELPPIQVAQFAGQKVLSTPQIAVLFDCTHRNVSAIFHKHEVEFEKDVDYFFLKGDDLTAFKLQNSIAEDEKFISLAQGKPNSTALPLRTVAKNVHSIFVYTKTGIFKLATFINTKRAKLVFQRLLLAYFCENIQEIEESELPLPESEFPEPIEPPKFSSNTEKIETLCNFLDKITAFLKECAMIEDKKLRDDLIKAAFNILKI